MSDLAAATGTRAQTVTHSGTEYTFIPATNGIKGQYTSFLETVRMQTTHRMGQFLSPEEQRVALAGSIDACGVLKEYEWGQRSCMLSLDTADGRAHFLWLCLQKHHPGISREKAREIYEGVTDQVMAAFAVLNPTLFFFSRASEGQATAETADPKAPAGATTPSD